MAEKLLTAQGNTHTHSIAMTAEAQESDRIACLEAGMDDYLSKPIQIDRLIATIKFWAHSIEARNLQASNPAPDIGTNLRDSAWPPEISVNLTTAD